MSARAGGIWLIAAAMLFWLSWCFMPGVGVTDAAQILERVAAQRGSVRLSVALQLLSAACYAPALLALALRANAEGARGLTVGATLLLMGAMGSAADSVFHWLAVEMTAPGVSAGAMLPVMARMQGPALIVVAPLIVAFFVGTAVLAVAATRARWVPRGCAALLLLSPLALVAGKVAGPAHARIAGLAFLACVGVVQAWIGAGLLRR